MHHYFLITPPAISRDQWLDQSSDLKKLSEAICSFVHLPRIPDANFDIKLGKTVSYFRGGNIGDLIRRQYGFLG